MYIKVDGRIQKAESDAIYTSEGLNFGYSLFETILVRNGKLIFFSQHVKRLNDSLELLGIDFIYDEESLRTSAEEVVEINCFENGALKILAAKSINDEYGLKTIISLRKTSYTREVYMSGFKLTLSEIVKNEKSLLPKIKSSNYLENLFEKQSAVKKGYDEVVFLNTEGYITETSASNIFFIKDRKVFTPSVDCGLLDGIIRARVIEVLEGNGYKVEEGKYRFSELIESDEVFLTNSLMEIMPVSKIEDKSFKRNKNGFGDITDKVALEYKKIIQRECDGFEY